ncbi:sugar phosphate isomerase/epimerase [Brachybacterium sp. YJGR34]|uniref:sugar phosphate isomerase/epimerase family protein n=1 Tax=Brachybacterium sp. YJGR34 TaxID=2059911 RepID=UPI000E0B6251|nr:sugar phosphate isomerase/epimerase [Brachybacterium sp. YJGR34]
MIHPGLCSVTFRSLDVAEVVALASQAGLERIEWGGDVHVPPGDEDAARRARELTEGAGLAVASYGSYLRFTGAEEEVLDEARAVIASARALGAPRIRVWAGRTPSARAEAEDRARIAGRIHAVAELAAAAGIGLGLEWHGGTLTDEIGSTEELLRAIDHPAVTTYWQPHQDQPGAEAVEDLQHVLDAVSTVHVFSWWPGGTRLALGERSDLWSEAFAVLAADGRDHDVLLEFVPGDDPALLAREARTLRSLLPAAAPAPGVPTGPEDPA